MARRTADTRGDPVVEEAIERGHVGSDTAYDVPAMPSHQIAREAARLIRNAAKRRNLSCGCWIEAQDHPGPCYDGWKGNPPCPAPDGPHTVRFKLWAKTAGRTYIGRTSGGDPANLKYNPWGKAPIQRYDDTGAPV